jgi:hypothetical protein
VRVLPGLRRLPARVECAPSVRNVVLAHHGVGTLRASAAVFLFYVKAEGKGTKFRKFLRIRVK